MNLIVQFFVILAISLLHCGCNDERRAVLANEEGATLFAIKVNLHPDYRSVEKLLGNGSSYTYADIFESAPRYSWVLYDKNNKVYAKLPISISFIGDGEVKETLVANISNKVLLCYIEREYSGRFFRSPEVELKPKDNDVGISITYRTITDENGERHPDIVLEYQQ